MKPSNPPIPKHTLDRFLSEFRFPYFELKPVLSRFKPSTLNPLARRDLFTDNFRLWT